MDEINLLVNLAAARDCVVICAYDSSIAHLFISHVLVFS